MWALGNGDRMLGWIPFSVIIAPIDEVKNPRPEWVQAMKEGKQYIAHWLDDYNIGMCKRAKSFTSSMSDARVSIAVDDIDISKSGWVESAVPCIECYKLWKKK